MIYVIREGKREELANHIGKAFRYLGKAMTCVENLESEDSEFGERRGGRYGMRVGRYGMRHGYRDDEDFDEDELNERRGYYPRYRY